MTARILVVDDVPANVKLLEARLGAEYFDVLTAADGPSALACIDQHSPDLVLLDVMMPGMDGFEVCRRIRRDPKSMHIPVVMVTALSDADDRVKGLEAGADDFLTKPVNNTALLARVRSLVRLKMMMDELRLREQTSGDLGVLGQPATLDEEGVGAGVVVLDDNPTNSRTIAEALAGAGYKPKVTPTGAAAMEALAGGTADMAIVNLGLKAEDALRYCSLIRSSERTRHLPILLVINEGDTARLTKGLEIGVNDYVTKPMDRLELIARARTQVRRRRFQERLRVNYQRGLELALTDSLTGLYNRRYVTTHLGGVLAQAAQADKPVALFMIDIDHFKNVNDTHGHPVGDVVLHEVAARITRGVRTFDTVARMGGEEFTVILPDARLDVAERVAERLRQTVGAQSIQDPRVPGGIAATVSIGVAIAWRGEDPDALIARADVALYRAKAGGRNRVVIDQPAARPALAANSR